MKRFTTILATSVTLLALAAPAAAAPNEPGGDPNPNPNPTPTTQPSPCGTVPPGTPHYRIKLVRFHAADESGPDDIGSDEPYFVFGSVGTDGTSSTRKSVTFGDVDSGETRNFGVWDYVWGNSCWGKLAPMGIGYSIQLWEEDGGVSESTAPRPRSTSSTQGRSPHTSDPSTRKFPGSVKPPSESVRQPT